MKRIQKIGLALIAALLGVGALGAAGSPAQAQPGDDTSWGWSQPSRNL